MDLVWTEEKERGALSKIFDSDVDLKGNIMNSTVLYNRWIIITWNKSLTSKILYHKRSRMGQNLSKMLREH